MLILALLDCEFHENVTHGKLICLCQSKQNCFKVRDQSLTGNITFTDCDIYKYQNYCDKDGVIRKTLFLLWSFSTDKKQVLKIKKENEKRKIYLSNWIPIL